MAILYDPIPNSPFYYPEGYNISTPSGTLIAGSGITVDPTGTLLVASALGGTVTAITAGVGLNGGTITTVGTIDLVAATPTSLGGIKVGANLSIAADGTLSALPPGSGTITNVSAGPGLQGGGSTGSVTLSVVPATTTTLGSVVVGSGINVVGGLISLASATTASAGGVTLATTAEVIAGLSATKVVTAQTLASKVASLTASGIVQLTDSTSSTSVTTAATPNSVKQVADAVIAAQGTATAALPRSGGTMTGIINFALGQTFPGVSLPLATTTSPGVVIPSTGLAITSTGYLTTLHNGTVTSLVMGPGIGAPASGDVITAAGTIRLLPPSADGVAIGGVKAGTNITIALDGTITTNGLLQTNNPYAYNSYLFPVATVPGQAPGANGTFLRLANNITGQLEWATVSNSVSRVDTGTGLTGGPITTTGTISLANSGVLPTGSVPTTFGATGLIPTLTIDVYGRVTSAGQAFPFSPFQIPSVSAPFNLILDFAQNNTNWEFTLIGNTALMNPTNASPGMRGSIVIRQNSITPYTLTFDTAWVFNGAITPAASNVVSAVDVLDFVVVSPTYIVVLNYLKGVG